jgi:hypothetical protein
MAIPLERVKGIEPSSSAWKAAALPLSYTRAGNPKPEFRGPMPISSAFPFRSSPCDFRCPQWWRGLDSNQRRHSQRVYSPSPLTTRAPLLALAWNQPNKIAPPSPAGWLAPFMGSSAPAVNSKSPLNYREKCEIGPFWLTGGANRGPPAPLARSRQTRQLYAKRNGRDHVRAKSETRRPFPRAPIGG